MSDELAIKLYQTISADSEPRVFDQWHASNIAECPRAQYFKRLGIEPINKPTGAKILRWQAGHLIEEVIRPHLKTIYKDLTSNIRLSSDKWDLTGEFDNYNPDGKTLIEIKSVGPRAIRYRKKDEQRHNLRDDQPYPSHVLQNHAYALLMDEHDFVVENIQFIYITLEGLIVTYKVPISKTNLNHVKDRLKLLSEAWKAQKPPECICQEDNPLYKSLLQFCDYKQEDNCCSLKLIKEKV